MRCCSLLRGMCVLEDACLGILTGTLERQLWETWLVSRDILLRGEKAVSELEEDYKLNTGKLLEGLPLRSKPAPDGKKDGKKKKPQRLDLRKLSKKLAPLLADAGDAEGAEWAAKGYFAVYRGQSNFSVHVGVSVLLPHIRVEERSFSVERNPRATRLKDSMVSLLCTLHLALFVFDRFGIATEGVQAVRQSLQDESETNRDTEGAPLGPE